VEKRRGESPVTVAAHVAAFADLGHEDEAREILADLERERGLDPSLQEGLIEAFAALARGAEG
jgi:hypothetical protein